MAAGIDNSGLTLLQKIQAFPISVAGVVKQTPEQAKAGAAAQEAFTNGAGKMVTNTKVNYYSAGVKYGCDAVATPRPASARSTPWRRRKA